MSIQTNQNFERLLEALASMGDAVKASPLGDPTYKEFIQAFPAHSLPGLSLDQYCVGKGNGASFCWWIERGLVPVLGRYMPGTSRGHILYFKKDGSVYKHRSLKQLSDEAALRYTLAIQATIAQAGEGESWNWIDDDAQLYQRAGVDPRVTMGHGRKLRLLSVYHPESALPISSSRHVGHFLEQLGCPQDDIPSEDQPVARMLRLREYFRLAQQVIPGLFAHGFIQGLYRPELDLAPKKDDEEEEVSSVDELLVRLTAGAIRNGYIRIPKSQSLFDVGFVAEDEQSPAETFRLDLPDATVIETCLIANRGRIKARFNNLFKKQELQPGDFAVLQRLNEGHFTLAFERTEQANSGNLPVIQPTPATELEALPPLNQILYGPPGTGKTYATIEAALAILDPAYLRRHREDRAMLKARFSEFERDRRVRFVTFHQSFSYEDFVEGIRASAGDDASTGLRYVVERGVFGDLCSEARRDRAMEAEIGVRDGATIWKISISEANSRDGTRDYCLANGEARIGWGHVKDIRQANLSDPGLRLGSKDQQSLINFANEVEVGDVMLCLGSKTSVRAVGVVTGDYEYSPQVPTGVRPDYVHRRAVHWLATDLDFDITALNHGRQLTLATIYPLRRIDWPALEDALRNSGVLGPAQGSAFSIRERKPYVLIIDEINRGSLSRIFGELITLIEPSKRAGAPEALEVVLPYSKKPFSVPDNVYLIGTMNTADRSLTGLDVALRRRFVFVPMPPRPEELRGIVIDELDVEDLLECMNQRIEALLDRDHCLGHAYFVQLRGAKDPLAMLATIFRCQVIPLLQEYFFDDWQRIQWVLNDHRKPKQFQFVTSVDVSAADLFGEGVTVNRMPTVWKVNVKAFERIESYLGVIDHRVALEAA
jgi:hypothetical protein